ncbi:MAG: Asp-tRNA(Asn)/Glu-tRNA(Gln) amidotransferase subunit GatC [Actinobacteria bacterium]|jgi:aspartyl-tRNA(Asn)/glutamyl-tRNA(Gln) amidotransferase subunit C|nr:Asp-tRNA(Asn)/Glu-tRNA(Gln) amidotransferase subunit GatC [Actinomycetota bacterium]
MASNSRISREEVARIAALARISLGEQELNHLAGQIDGILDAVAVVQEAAGAAVPAMSHPLEITNVTRPDVILPSLTPDQALSGAPASEDSRFRVPQILGEEA